MLPQIPWFHPNRQTQLLPSRLRMELLEFRLAMMLQFSWLKSLSQQFPARSRRKQRSIPELRVDVLESRTLLTTFLVDATNDDFDATPGDGSAQTAGGTTTLRAAIQEANRVIVLRRQNPAFSSMGTTVVGAMIKGDEITLAHAGDSRARIRAGGC